MERLQEIDKDHGDQDLQCEHPERRHDQGEPVDPVPTPPSKDLTMTDHKSSGKKLTQKDAVLPYFVGRGCVYAVRCASWEPGAIALIEAPSRHAAAESVALTGAEVIHVVSLGDSSNVETFEAKATISVARRAAPSTKDSALGVGPYTEALLKALATEAPPEKEPGTLDPDDHLRGLDP